MKKIIAEFTISDGDEDPLEPAHGLYEILPNTQEWLQTLLDNGIRLNVGDIILPLDVDDFGGILKVQTVYIQKEEESIVVSYYLVTHDRSDFWDLYNLLKLPPDPNDPTSNKAA